MGSSSVAVKAGDTLEGRYKIIKTVGEGGMGTVFLAEHMLIKRKVAIKILRPELATDSVVVERFMNEARAAGAIGHPHIVESTDMGFTRDEVPFIVFEYLEGTLLTDEIYRVRGLPPRRALRIAAQIASALHAAHGAGIIHRDLKSDNIFLTDKEEASDHVKVLDFGISRFLETDSSDISSSRQIMGTPEFMAPEQITAPETVDKRADIYALGVVLYEMLAARRPFDFDSPHTTMERTLEETDQLLQKIVTETPPPLGRPDLPPGLEELIHDKLLAKSPDDRFESMKDVQGALEAFTTVARRDSEPIAVVSRLESEPGITTSPTIPPAAKKSSGLGWLVAAMLTAGVGGALIVLDPELPGTEATGPDMTALQADADKLGATIDSEAQAAHLRAEGIGSTPMLRAAIETDAATLRDMVADRDVLFKPKPGEVLEVFQVKGGQTTTMLRLPATSGAVKPIGANETRLETVGNELRIVVGATISTQQGAPGGVLALAGPVDLSAVKQTLAQRTTSATLVGLAQPLVLAGSGNASGTPVTLAVKTSPQSKVTGLSLSVVANAPESGSDAVTENPLRYVRYGAFGLAGLLLVMFIVSKARRR